MLAGHQINACRDLRMVSGHVSSGFHPRGREAASSFGSCTGLGSSLLVGARICPVRFAASTPFSNLHPGRGDIMAIDNWKYTNVV